MLIAICRVAWKCKFRNLQRQGSFCSSCLRLLHECLHVISVLRRKTHFRLRLIGSASSLRDSSYTIVIACRASYHRYVEMSLCKGLHRECEMYLCKNKLLYVSSCIIAADMHTFEFRMNSCI
jgi:hypothetical protein